MQYGHPRNERKHNVINVDICVFKITEDIFHDFLSIIRGAFKTHISLNLPEGVAMVHKSFCWSSSSKVWYCIEMSNVVRNSYPLCPCKISHMIGSGYCFLLTILFNSHKSLTQHTLSCFWGVINVGKAHSLAPCGDKMPIFTKCSNSFLKALGCITGTGYGLAYSAMAHGTKSIWNYLWV